MREVRRREGGVRGEGKGDNQALVYLPQPAPCWVGKEGKGKGEGSRRLGLAGERSRTFATASAAE